MLVYLRLLKESLSFAINALRNNKLRTLLSLLGVTIGIFSIIAVLAAVDSLDKKISKDLSSLDKNTIYLMKFNFGPSEIPQWKREQFPNVKYDEYVGLKNSMNNTDQVGYQLFVNRETLKYDSKTVSDVNIIPSSSEMVDIDGLSFDRGRFYNESESKDFIIDKTGGEFNLRVFAPLVFEPLVKNDLNLPSLRIDAVTVNLSRSKIIKKEGVEGRDSTIKEHITNGDFSISIEGLIANETGDEYPKEKLFLLKQFLNAPYALRVTHAILNRFGIYELVIDSYSIPSISGTKNIQKFTASATSDETVELIIRDNA